MNTIHLRLKNKCYKAVMDGGQSEIYRTIKPYWIKQLCFSYRTGDCKEKTSKCAECFRVASQFGGYMCYPYSHAWMNKGQTDRFIVREIEEISYGMGDPAFGAPEDKPVFIFRFKKGDKK